MRSSTPRHPLTLAAAALCFAAAALAGRAGRAAPGDAKDVVAVLELETSGVSDALAREFEGSLEEGLTGAGFAALPRDKLVEKLAGTNYISGCVLGPCLVEIHRSTQIPLVLVASIVNVGPSFSFVVSLADTRSGKMTAQVAHRCDICTVDEALASATLAVIELVTAQAFVDRDMSRTGEPIHASPAVELDRLQRQVQRSRRAHRGAAVAFLAAAAAASGTAMVFFSRGENDQGYPALAAGGSLAVASAALLVLAHRF